MADIVRRAALCSAFDITRAEYGRLTLGEIDELTTVLNQSRSARKTAPSGTNEPTRLHRPKPRPGVTYEPT